MHSVHPCKNQPSSKNGEEPNFFNLGLLVIIFPQFAVDRENDGYWPSLWKIRKDNHGDYRYGYT